MTRGTEREREKNIMGKRENNNSGIKPWGNDQGTIKAAQNPIRKLSLYAFYSLYVDIRQRYTFALQSVTLTPCVDKWKFWFNIYEMQLVQLFFFLFFFYLPSGVCVCMSITYVPSPIPSIVVFDFCWWLRYASFISIFFQIGCFNKWIRFYLLLE